MPTLLTLPDKIICNILQVLGRSNMFPFLTVNKQLHLIAIEEFYKGLILNQGHLELFELNFLPRDPTDNASFRKHHHYIKEVNLSRLQPTKIVDTDRFFFVGIFFFPSLTSIDVSNDFRKLSILEYLLYFVNPNILPHLQKIKAFKTGTRANKKTSRIIKSLYMCACFRFRDSLTHFELLEPSENYALHTKGTYRSHLDLLPFFKKVTHLVLYCQLQDEQVDRLITSTVITACPDLIAFQIVCNSEYKEKPDDSTYAKEDYPTIKRVIRNMIDNAEDIPIHLKNVSLELRKMNTVCMNSILNNIPTSQLDKFKLSLTCKQELIDWVANTPTDTIKEFFQHVKLAKEPTITSQYAYPLLTPKETMQSTVYPVRKLWAISNALTQRDSKIILQIHFSKAETENALFYTFELENNILKISQVVGEKNFFSGNYSYLQMVPFYDHVFGEAIDEMSLSSTDTKIYKARLEFLHKGCEEVSICYGGQAIYNKPDGQMNG